MLYIFDLDGTLTDTLATISHYGNSALVKNGFDTIATDRYRYLVGDGRDVLIHRMLAESGLDTDENFLKVRTDYDNGYENNMLYLTQPYDGIIPAIESLKDNGNTLAVLSNKPAGIVKSIINEMFPDGLFALVEGQRDGVPVKPDPQSALAIASELGFAPDECIFVGDTNVDIRTGKNAGMKTVGVLWGFRDRRELSEAGADVIIEKTSELTDI